MTDRPRRVALLTREYPPEVYGGAGVHVEYLARALSGLVDLTVHCQGAPRDTAVAHQTWPELRDPALAVFSADLSMAGGPGGLLGEIPRTPVENTGPSK